MQETHCRFCGSRLVEKPLEHEGIVPFCETCGEYRFPGFNVAVSMIVRSPEDGKIVLIRQYGRQDYILVAGYVSKGESAENAVCREVAEELGATVASLCFNQSRYYERSNTLMLNFVCTLESPSLSPNYEIDSYAWFTEAEAMANIKPESLAKAFLAHYLETR